MPRDRLILLRRGNGVPAPGELADNEPAIDLAAFALYAGQGGAARLLGLPISGGVLTGPLQLPDGTALSPSLRLGANDGTGLARAANAIVLSVQGATVFGAFSASAQFYTPLSLLGNPIQQLADPFNPTDAVTKRYVDNHPGMGISAADGDARWVNLTGDTMSGQLTAPSLLANNGRILSANANNNPSVTVWDTGQGAAAGMLLGGGNLLYFASMNGDGTYAGTRATLDAVGNLITVGRATAINGVAFDGGGNYAAYCDVANNCFVSYTSGWYDLWEATNGNRSWWGNNTLLMSLSGVGTLNVGGAVTAVTTVTAGGSLEGAQAYLTGALGVYYGGLGTNWIGFQWDGSNVPVYVNGGYAATLVSSTWVNNNYEPRGAYHPNQLVDAGSSPIFYSVFFGSVSDWVMTVGGRGRIFGFSMPYYYWDWDASAGHHYWCDWVALATTGGGTHIIFHNGDGNVYNTVGDFWFSSDARLKHNIAASPYGLEAVMRLNPVGFERRGIPGRREIGFVAQDVLDVIPEAVSDPDVEGVSMLCLSDMPLLAACVRAIQELAAEVAALKQRMH
jgi:hypothetical protein